ncbi:NAD(P)H-binding protein [Chitinophaga rhizophila]|uniref:NAD(P)H-binding protein n=1 Tax=Chitinophaga rhizophila TaxID=2866212 RepID=A0ABS7GF53_9BACT|nr:NAD(P)H-binding protein [Chitinophaga rhizophila]MBW8685138.1 NAD(P)H-binding protein [Chitinophaga rhizophila]
MLQTAVVIGATGLTGHHLVTLLLHDPHFSKVKVLVRTPSFKQRPGLEEIVVDFNDTNSLSAALQGDVLFCCIGTTIRKAGSQERFRDVDFEIPVRCATLARRQGMQQFLLLSSTGAAAHSRNFYLRTKGETEQAIQQLGYSSLHIFRPSILLGARNEFRLGESLGKVLVMLFYFLLIGHWKKYRPVKAATVANAMLNAAKTATTGVRVYEYDGIKELGSKH